MKHLSNNKPIVNISMFVSLILAITILFGGASLAATPQKSEEFHPNMINRSAISQESIDSYREKVNTINKELISEKKSDIKTTITFSKPIDFKKLKDYTKKHSINLYEVVIRGIQPDGTRTTLFAGNDANQEMVISTIEGKGDTFVGAVAIKGYVDAKDLQSIMDNSLTYLADTSNDAQQVRSNANVNIIGTKFINHIAWQLEDLGVNGYNYKQK